MTETDPNNSVEEVKEVTPTDVKPERNWTIFCHLSALLMFVVPPIGNILGPLVIWLIKKTDMPLVDREGKAALNFQISMSIYMFVAFLLCFIAIGVPLMFFLVVANVILVIIASIKMSNGEQFSYPCTIHFLK